MLWATDAPFRVYLVENLNSNFIVLVEHFFSVIILLPLLFLGFKGLRKLKVKEWFAVIVIAVGGSALASIAFTQAFHYVNPSVAILLQKLQPFIAIGLATSLLHENMNKRFWLWAILAIAGAYLISFPGITPKLFPGEQFNPNLIGVSLALLAAILWGASTVFGKFVLKKIDFKLMTSLRFVLAFVFLLILNLFEGTIPALSSVTGKDWSFLFIVAMTSGAVSLFIYYKGLQFTKASIATIAELGFPMAAVLVNWIFIDAGLSPLQIAGMAVLLFSIMRLSRYNQASQERLKAEPVKV